MKRFLLYTFCFVILLISFYGILLGRYCYVLSQQSFEIPKEKNILIIGDSQTQACIDDNIVSNAKNISLAHDGYFTMYKRLQLFADANPQIDTVILALSPHTVSPVKDEFYHNFGYVEQTTKSYLPYLKCEEWMLLLQNDPADVFSALCTPISYYLHPTNDNIKQLGFFEVADYSHLEEDIKEGATRLIPDSMKVDYGNEITLKYLHKIVDYCDTRKIKIIGISTPVLDGEKYFDMDNYSRIISSEFKDVEIWDYMSMEFPDSCRRDVNHLNKWGAKIFSEGLKKRLKK